MDHLQLVPSAGASKRPARAGVAASTADWKRRRLKVGVLLAAADAAILLASTALGLLCGWLWSGIFQIGAWTWTFPAGWICGALLTGLYPGWGRGRLDELQHVLRLFAAAATVAAVTTLLAGDPPSAPFYLSFGAALVSMPPLRAHARARLGRAVDWGMPAVVYGAGEEAIRVLRHLRSEPGLGLDPVAIVDDDPARVGRRLDGFDVLGRAGDRIPAAPAAVVAMAESGRRRSLIERLTRHYDQVILMAGPLERVQLLGQTADLDGELGVVLTAKLGSPLARRLKRGTELLLAYLTAPVWAPVLAVLAAAVWLEDRHPPFLKQERIGRDGTPYANVRLRCVVPNPGERLRTALQENAELRREWETRFRLEKDPRVTRVGGVLRRLGLEGLPQILHVVGGRMALVGPQPLPPYRHASSRRDSGSSDGLDPGMTGLWSVYGDREEHASGTHYARAWSMWLDLAVLMEEWVTRVRPRRAP